MQFFMFTVTTQLNNQGVFKREEMHASITLCTSCITQKTLVYKSKGASLYQIIFRLM